MGAPDDQVTAAGAPFQEHRGQGVPHAPPDGRPRRPQRDGGRPAVELRQQYQRVEGEWLGEGVAPRRIEGRMSGAELTLADGSTVLRLQDGALRTSAGPVRYTRCPG